LECEVERVEGREIEKNAKGRKTDVRREGNKGVLDSPEPLNRRGG